MAEEDLYQAIVEEAKRGDPKGRPKRNSVLSIYWRCKYGGMKVETSSWVYRALAHSDMCRDPDGQWTEAIT